MTAAVTVLPAGESAMQHLAAVLVQHSQVLSSGSASLLATAALELHAAASPMLQGCFSLTDSNAELVQQLLEGLHVALQHSGHVDGVLRGSVALRLAAVLEEQQQLDRGLDVVQEVRSWMHAVVNTRRSTVLSCCQRHRQVSHFFLASCCPVLDSTGRDMLQQERHLCGFLCSSGFGGCRHGQV
jgi:hypothetical protein